MSRGGHKLFGSPLRKQVRPVTGARTIGMAIERAGYHIIHAPTHSAIIVLSVASGIALAIAIIAASNGVDEQVKIWLNVKSLPPQVNLGNIHKVLDQTRDTLTILAFIF